MGTPPPFITNYFIAYYRELFPLLIFPFYFQSTPTVRDNNNFNPRTTVTCGFIFISAVVRLIDDAGR